MLTNEVTLCQDSVDFKIVVQGVPEISDVFTPNDDGINDSFSFSEYSMQSVDVEIYNRWGQMVFKSTNINNQWDGKFQQINSPPGTYVYKIKTTDFGAELKLIKSGTVSLVR